MSRSAATAFEWGDGEHTFRLAIKHVEELQEKTGCGPFFLLNRIQSGEWRVADLRETIRLGLIGGGMDPLKALALVKAYVDERPLVESVAPARAILMALLVGAPDGEAPGKSRAARARREANRSQADASPLPPSTEPGLQ